MMEAFLRALTNHYSGDRIAAGLQTAYLPDQDKFYCAVHRFPTNVASRTVVAKATEDTFDAAVAKCREVWDQIILQSKLDKSGYGT